MPLYICGSNGGNSHGADPAAAAVVIIIIVIISIGGAAVSVVVRSTGRVGVQIGWGGWGAGGLEMRWWWWVVVHFSCCYYYYYYSSLPVPKHLELSRLLPPLLLLQTDFGPSGC